MSWSKRHYPSVPKYGAALAGLAALVALSPLTVVTQQPASAATAVNYHAAATLTGPLERYLQRHSRERQPLDWDQRQELLPRFETDIKLLADILGESFADWNQPRERSGGMVGGRPAGQSQARNGRRIVTKPQPLAQLGEQRV